MLCGVYGEHKMNNIGLLSSLLTTSNQSSIDGLSSNAQNLLNQINSSWLNGGQLINRPNDQMNEQDNSSLANGNKTNMSRQAAIGGEQHELIKRIKEKSDMYMLQQQQIKFINGHLLAAEQKRSAASMNEQQIPIHSLQQQQQQVQHLSKEYILSQVRAQQKQENTIKQHQKQQLQRQQHQEAMLIKQQQMLIQQQNYQKLVESSMPSTPSKYYLIILNISPSLSVIFI